MKYYSSKTLAKMLGVTTQTLRNWNRNGKLMPSYTKNNGYRYYSEEVVNEFLNIHSRSERAIRVVGYARVSSRKQKDDLERQIENLSTILSKKYENFEIIKDIGSGINYDKPGLKELIKRIDKHEGDIIVVLYKDRLLRYGYELVEYFAKLNNVEIIVLDKVSKTSDQELVEDLVQIITVFSCKLQGKRANKARKLVKELIEEGGNDDKSHKCNACSKQ